MSETMEMAVAGEVRSITAITDEIIFYKNVGGQAVIEIGKRLIEAKAQLRIRRVPRPRGARKDHFPLAGGGKNIGGDEGCLS